MQWYPMQIKGDEWKQGILQNYYYHTAGKSPKLIQQNVKKNLERRKGLQILSTYATDSFRERERV